jgi:nucleotide-binding universal stress UspA family protein
MKIMVCHDGSPRAQDALERAVELFKPTNPEIALITVVEPPLDATSVDEESFDKWKTKRDEDLKKAAQWVATHGLNVDAILAEGDPRKMIIECAEKRNPDILVVARRGVSVLDKMVLGSVSAYVVRHAHCPVIVI